MLTNDDTGQASIIFRDAWKALPEIAAVAPFQLIFADPPYGQEAGSRLLAEIAHREMLEPGGLLVLETACADPVPADLPGLPLVDQRRYGITMIHLLQRPASEASS